MKNLILIVPLIVLVTACGELSYKRGASVADLERDKSACKTMDDDETALKSCLVAKGWSLQNLQEASQFESLSVEQGDVINEQNKIAPIATIQIEASQPDSRGSSVKPMPENASTQMKAQKTEPESRLVAPKPIAATDLYIVTSWWKLGAKNDGFSQDSESCHISLGELHAPNHALQQYTAAFLVCMRDKHWKASAKTM